MNEITEQLWVGDIMDVREGSTKRFDRVVTVCQDSVEDNIGCAYDFFPVADGANDSYKSGDPSYQTFEKAADAVVSALEDDEVVLVHCHAGRSRSASVALCALAVTEGYDFETAERLIEERNGIYQPSDNVKRHAKRYVREHER